MNIKKFKFLILMVFGTANSINAQWGEDVRLTNDPAISMTAWTRNSGIAANGKYIHIVWQDDRDGNPEIYYKRSDNEGISWSADTRLTNNDSVSRVPAVALSDSVLHIVWRDNRNGANGEIYYKYSTDNGVNWGTDMRLTNDSGISSHPGIAVSGLNVYVIWRDDRDGNTEIYLKKSTDGGKSWGNDIRITNDWAGSYNPSVSVLGLMVHIVWEDQRDGNSEIYYKCSTDGGINWSKDTRLTNNPYVSNLPASVVNDSNVYIVWNDYRDGNNEIYYKHSFNAGLSWESDTRLTNAFGNSWWPSLAASGKSIHIIWQDDRNGSGEIFYKYSKNGGLNWSADTVLVDNLTTISEYPAVALTGSKVHLIWTDMRDGPNGEVYYKSNPATKPVSIINNLANGSEEVIIFPNPFSENINIEIANAENAEINIYDQTGKLIRSLECQAYNGRRSFVRWNGLDKNNLRVVGGVYYFKVSLGNKLIVKKIVVL